MISFIKNFMIYLLIYYFQVFMISLAIIISYISLWARVSKIEGLALDFYSAYVALYSFQEMNHSNKVLFIFISHECLI